MYITEQPEIMVHLSKGCDRALFSRLKLCMKFDRTIKLIRVEMGTRKEKSDMMEIIEERHSPTFTFLIIFYVCFFNPRL